MDLIEDGLGDTRLSCEIGESQIGLLIFDESCKKALPSAFKKI